MSQQTLLGNSKTRGKVSLHMMFEDQEDRGYASVVMHSHSVGN
jgi:hypothetical protein